MVKISASDDDPWSGELATGLSSGLVEDEAAPHEQTQLQPLVPSLL